MTDILDKARLDGRIALIVGGGGHIGTAAAGALSSVGAHIVIADVDLERAQSVSAALEKMGHSATAEYVDLEDSSSCRSLICSIERAHGRLDVLIHTAALVGASPLPGWTTPFQEQSVETWRRAIEVNLTSAFVLIQASESLLSKSGRGSVVLVSSIYGSRGPDPSLYSGTSMGAPAGYFASKGGLDSLTRWLAVTLAPAIRVNAISPGGIRRGQDEIFVERYTAKVPLARMGTEEDLAGAFIYLCSDLSAYVTGQNVFVDGGLTAR